MENTLVRGGITEAADGDRSVIQILGCESRTGGDTLTGADDTVCAQRTQTFDIGNVHRTALALAVAGCLSEQFSHSLLRISAPGNCVTVASVCGAEIVILANRCESACLCSFLTDTQMNVACQHAFHEAVCRMLLEGSDSDHCAVEIQSLFL